MLRLRSLTVLCGFAVVVTACGASDDESYSQMDNGVPSAGGSPGESSGTGGTATGVSGGGGSGGASSGTSESIPGEGTGEVQPGQLTAGDWDDNLNFDLFRAYSDKNSQTVQSDGRLDSGDRVVVRVSTETGLPVSNARVTITSGNEVFLTAPTASDGRLLFFPRHDGADGATDLQVRIEPPAGAPGSAVTLDAPTGSDWELVLPGGQPRAPMNLDLAFVVDTTGSMGDELSYLNAELDSIASMVHAGAEGLSVRYGLVLYRDAGDEYVTRSFDFTSDLVTFKGLISQQSADGGGDFEEAVHEGVKTMNGLSWRDDNTARLAFLIGDAPPHSNEQAQLVAQVDQARIKGIKLYPVAASGTDAQFEYLMRSAAQWTLARYLFITDDSGIGGSHAEPTIPCYEVRYLNQLMTRIILAEVQGKLLPTGGEEVLRSVGNPVDGVCSFDDGTEARL